jgi:hypothetical protein
MSSPGIGASGIVGVAIEAVVGTYLAPTKFIPIMSESLTRPQATTYRRPIRNTSGLVGALPGNSHVEGDVQFEVTSDTIIYFLRAMRCTMAKTGTGPYTYVFTPSSAAVAGKTLSITVVRNGIVFGYVGCVVGQLTLEVTDGELMATASVVGLDEAEQTLPTPTWPTTVPYGAGTYSLQIPTASQIFDTDTFSFQVNDNADAQYRIDTTTAANYILFGESEGTLTVARDFLDRTEYDAFKALTSKSITLLASNGASDRVTILAPVAIVDTYEVGLSAQGDEVRASIAYQLAIDGTGKHYSITVLCLTESIT